MASGLTSSSTLAQINAVYDNNATYAESQSVSKCTDFITACVMLLRRRATSLTKGSSSYTEDNLAIREELAEARRWKREHSTSQFDQGGARVTRASFRYGK